MTTTATRQADSEAAGGDASSEDVASPTTIASSHDWLREAPRLSASPTAVRVARRIVHSLAGRGTGGTLILIEGPDCDETSLGTGDPVVRVTINDPRAYVALLQRGSIGLGEAYAAGWLDADDLTAFIRVLSRRTEGMMAAADRLAQVTKVRDVLSRRAPDRRSDKRNIQAHYDVSNEFYELMLDPTMSYSCAIFDIEARSGRRPSGRLTLQQAQEAKLSRICDKLSLTPADHLVEIGTGWGGLALHAARNYGCRVTTTTISEAQRRYAEKRLAEAGLADRIEVIDRDWRDLDGSYTKLVSVEMIEAVDWRNHAEFLRKCGDLLDADGVGLIQAIVIEGSSFERAKHRDDFIRSMIFPASCLPSVASLADDLIGSGLALVGLEDIGNNYAETLATWRANLAANAEAVEKLGMPDEFHRIWHLYLCYCEAAYLEGHISDVQLILAKERGWGRTSAVL